MIFPITGFTRAIEMIRLTAGFIKFMQMIPVGTGLIKPIAGS